ncbi:G-protein coupled receptor 84-like [Haliotis rufescens]|uniref:G-protein coupled receptor 84-like n=1 Tax=Haliotis rufescens TaxID=6454 RepID=UPI00201F015A|nr:G-protein coupled receptor 84-like [Haliotis rufescens]XP_046377427.2 G-protein coupled receptor 84-like [Haliotis rufescens]
MAAYELPSFNDTIKGDNSTLAHALDPMIILQSLNDKKSILLAPVIAYTVVLMTIGIIGNPIAIFIYAFRWPRTTTKCFLLCLAVLDLCNCLITMPTEIALMVNFYYFSNSVICKISRFTTYTMNNASVFVLLVVAIDRFIRICLPHDQPISIRGSKIACGVSVVVGVGVSWPALVIYGPKYVDIPIPGGPVITGVMCQVEHKYSTTPYPLAFMIYLWVAFCVIAVAMTALYIMIGREIIKRKRMKKQRGACTSSHVAKLRNESASITNNDSTPASPIPTLPTSPTTPPAGIPSNDSASSAATLLKGRLPALSTFKLSKGKLRPGKTTVMLFAITMVYILSFLPFLIIGIIRLRIGAKFYPNLSGPEEVAVNLFLRSYLVNNCANPVVYGLCNSQFRKEFRDLFRSSCKKHGAGL